MKKRKLSILASAFIVGSVLMLSGCGDDDDNSTHSTTTSQETPANPNQGTPNNGNETTPSDRNVTVVDGYVIGATVKDCNGTTAKTNKFGVATAPFNPNCSQITSTGGWIDVDNNGKFDKDIDLNLTNFSMSTPASKNLISPITELIAAGVNEDKLAQLLGVSKDKLYSDPYASNDINMTKAIQIAFVLEASGKTEDFKNRINSINTTNTQANNAEQNNTETNNNEESDLPNIVRYSLRDINNSNNNSDLPAIGHYGNASSKLSNPAPSNSEAIETGSLEAFANIAKSLYSSDSNEYNLIDTIIASPETNASLFEQNINDDKKDFLSSISNNQNTSTEQNTSTTEQTPPKPSSSHSDLPSFTY